MTHAHGPDAEQPAVSHRLLLVIVGLIGLAGVVGMALGPPTRLAGVLAEPPGGSDTRLLDARIEGIEVAEVPLDDPTLLPGAIDLDITARLESGEQVTFSMTDETGGTFRVGQLVKLAEVDAGGGEPTYYISDFQRTRPLLLLLGLFLAAVIVFGRMQGVRAIIGLGLTLLIITRWLVPAILLGHNPVVAALSCAAVIMILTLYLSHGFHPKTTAAAVGTGAALALTGALSWLFVRAAAITGMTSEEARMATLQVGGLSLRGLLLAGIIIGGLGVLDDVTMSQASTVMQLRRLNPAASFGELMRGGIAVGRDHIAATVNTLFLAYAGASLPLLLLFTTSQDSFANILTSEVVAVELVRTLVGSLGLIAAVPLTTALAAALVRPAAVPAPLGAPAAAPPAADDPAWERDLRDAYGLPPISDQDS